VLDLRYFNNKITSLQVADKVTSIESFYNCEHQASWLYAAGAECDSPCNPSWSPFTAAASLSLDSHNACEWDGVVNGQTTSPTDAGHSRPLRTRCSHGPKISWHRDATFPVYLLTSSNWSNC